MVFSEGSNRRKYGGTVTRHGLGKGDYVLAERKGIQYQGLGQFSKNKVQLLRRSTGLICKQLVRGSAFLPSLLLSQ